MTDDEATANTTSPDAVGAPVERPIRPDRDYKRLWEQACDAYDRKNRSGCCCALNPDSDEVRSPCAMHADWKAQAVATADKEWYGKLEAADAEIVRLRADATALRELLNNSQTAVCVANRTLVLDDLPGQIAEALARTAYLKT